MFHCYIIYRHVVFFLAIDVKKASWQGTDLLGELPQTYLEREDSGGGSPRSCFEAKRRRALQKTVENRALDEYSRLARFYPRSTFGDGS